MAIKEYRQRNYLSIFARPGDVGSHAHYGQRYEQNIISFFIQNRARINYRNAIFFVIKNIVLFCSLCWPYFFVVFCSVLHQMQRCIGRVHDLLPSVKRFMRVISDLLFAFASSTILTVYLLSEGMAERERKSTMNRSKSALHCSQPQMNVLIVWEPSLRVQCLMQFYGRTPQTSTYTVNIIMHGFRTIKMHR